MASSIESLEQSLRETLKKEAAESERRRKAAQIQQQAWDQHRVTVSVPNIQAQISEEQLAKSAVASTRARELEIERRKQEVKVKVRAQMSRVEQQARHLDDLRRVRFSSIFFVFCPFKRLDEARRVRFSTIVFVFCPFKRLDEFRRVRFSSIVFVFCPFKRLHELHRELESLEDPTKKEVAEIRKKIETLDRELRPLKLLCDKKEKELNDAVEAYNDRSKLKTELVTKLMEIVMESEKLRMNKLDEMNRHLEMMERQEQRA